MFDIARFNPGQQGADDKKRKLASLNDRLKQKRTKTNDNETPVQATAVADASPVEPAPSVQVAEPVKQPHREKRKKQVVRIEEANDADVEAQRPAKEANILKKFHNVLDRAAAREQSPVSDQEVQETIEEDTVPVADLVPVPQPTKSAVKRQTIGSNAGLPPYLQHPNVISTSLSVPFTKLPLSKKIQDNLQKCEFDSAFAVQAALLPVLLASHLPEARKDILVSAPTGSGKTLTYVLPILQILQTRRITRLRALIIVPTRELVQQVQSTFESLSSKLGLKIEAMSATRPFSNEQSLLVNDYEPTAPSNVDIIICTPGRLVDHLKSTPRFTLRDLRFLVIDEGDRLLNQSFQGWSAEIDEALKPLRVVDEAVRESKLDIFTTKSEERCQKLIFSATMSTDPSLLAQLNLTNPSLYLIQHGPPTESTSNAASEVIDTIDEDLDGEDVVSKFTTPASLTEYFIHVPEQMPKPLTLLTAIHKLSVTHALIFTNSNESAQKLTSLMKLLEVGSCEAFTSTITQPLRRRQLADFSNGQVKFLICSDLMARGIDTAVPCVINYDSSISTRQYVHRVGRTARAGKPGLAMSLVEGSESKYWWRQIGGRKIRRARELTRVTLFPKDGAGDMEIKEDESARLEVAGRDSSEQQSGDEDEDEDESQSEDDGEHDESSGDEASGVEEHRAIRRKPVSRGPAPSTVPMVEVDQDGLRTTYENALKTLRSRS